MSNFLNLIEQRIVAVAGAGLGTLTLGQAVAGRNGFKSADNGLPFRVLIFEGNAWEICEATYTHAGATLARGAVEESSSGVERVAFTPSALVRQVLSAAVIKAIETAANAEPPEIPELPDHLVTRATNGALMDGSIVAAPAYLGQLDEDEITAVHAGIAAGTISYPLGSMLTTEEGVPWTLQGLGTAARFTPNTTSAPPPEVIVQPIRTGPSNANQDDAGTLIPFSSVGTYTVVAGLDDFSTVIERADAASAKVLAGSGVTLWHNGATVTELEITGIGHYIVIRPRATGADHYQLARYTGV